MGHEISHSHRQSPMGFCHSKRYRHQIWRKVWFLWTGGMNRARPISSLISTPITPRVCPTDGREALSSALPSLIGSSLQNSQVSICRWFGFWRLGRPIWFLWFLRLLGRRLPFELLQLTRSIALVMSFLDDAFLWNIVENGVVGYGFCGCLLVCLWITILVDNWVFSELGVWFKWDPLDYDCPLLSCGPWSSLPKWSLSVITHFNSLIFSM